MIVRNLSVIVCSLVLAVVSDLQAQQRNRPGSTPAVTPSVRTTPNGYGSGIPVNYVRTWDANAPITDPNAMVNADFRDVLQTTDYIDGLGRTLQTVNRKLTRQGADLVFPIEYDEFGRETFKYLPYVSTDGTGLFKTDPFNSQKAYLKTQHADEDVFYSKTEFEASPLNRVVKDMAPGNSWTGNNKGTSLDYLINKDIDAVRIWNINNDPLTFTANDHLTNIPYSPAQPTYNAGELYKNVMKNEDGNVSVFYKDKEGKVILRKVQVGNIAADYTGYSGFLCTYYIYDDLNRLRYVLPPKAVAQLNNNGWTFTKDIVNELTFRYEYDSRNRVIAKKVPGSDWVYVIYDIRDRVVFTQDGNMRKNGQWMCTLYDALNRQVMTGMMTGYTGGAAALQLSVTIQTQTGQTVPPNMAIDLVLPNAQQQSPFAGTYQAFNSITLDVGFETQINADFTAEINTGTSGNIPEESIIEGMTINKNPIPLNVTFIPLTKTYLDDYNWTNRSYTTAYNTKLDPGTSRHPVTMPSASSTNTTDLVTGTQVRVISDANNLAAGNWLTTVNFYDNRNQLIQVHEETQKGLDIKTNLYEFSGRIICSYFDHVNPAGNPASVKVKTSYNYDHAGRLLEVWKTLNDQDSKKSIIAKYDYDEFGQLKNKQLGHKKDENGNYTASTYDPLETLDYSYNIRGWMTGINKDYANGLSSPNGTSPWFGVELSYDKGFEKNQLNGNIAGAKWRSKGDGAQRAYGYTYDKVNRLLGADFTQHDGSNYVDNTIINFDMEVGNAQAGIAAYDENGNIKAMRQFGLKLNKSELIDDLVYDYHKDGNRLRSVTDNAVNASGVVGGSWGLGDFTDKNKTGADYGYDANGNLTTDLNKNLPGNTDPDLTTGGTFTYNYLNLPWKLDLNKDDGSLKGTISYVYDAGGMKLQKKVLEKGATVTYNNASYTSDITTTTSYAGGFVYESKEYNNGALAGLAYTDKLQYVGLEEGRARYLVAEDANPARFEYDFFVRDNQGNVRMVLTEERKTDVYQATMETAKRSFELKLFGDKITSTEKNKSELLGGFDADNDNQKVSRLNGSTAEGRVGPGVILKVMAGDKIKAFTYAWYRATSMDNTTDPGLPSILTNLLGQLAPGVSGILHGTVTTQVPNNLLQPGMENFLGTQNAASGAPKAYLNWVLLDEQQFKMVNGGAVPVPAINDDQKRLLQANNGNEIMMEKNGYLYVFVSNESKGDVYFDDIRVEHSRGPVVEETHYYPFGLTMAGISSKAAGLLENKYKFNGGTELDSKEFSDGSGLDLYSTDFRSYDAQIGRFHQIDLLSAMSYDQSPYAYVNNNPILFIDPLGLDTLRSETVPGEINVGDVWVKPGENGTEWYYTYDPENENAATEGDMAGFVSDGSGNSTLATVTVSSGKKSATAPAASGAGGVPGGTGPANGRPGGRGPITNLPGGITFGKNANRAAISQYSIDVLSQIMRESNNPNVTITSTARNPESQARAMYQNITKNGVQFNLDLYGVNGDRVVRVAARGIKEKQNPAVIQAAMAAEIRRLGPSNVSKHCGDPNFENVMDISPGTIRNKSAFVREIRERGIFLLEPPDDPVYHLQIRQ